jgi:hypothetical protein
VGDPYGGRSDGQAELQLCLVIAQQRR